MDYKNYKPVIKNNNYVTYGDSILLENCENQGKLKFFLFLVGPKNYHFVILNLKLNLPVNDEQL